jgi:hypothetical protein
MAKLENAAGYKPYCPGSNPGSCTKEGKQQMLILALLLHWGFILMIAIGWIILAIGTDE